jgi:hypothetical protein
VAKSITYDRHIKPHFHRWATEGFAKYRGHPATVTALTLAGMVLDWKPTAEYSYQVNAWRLLQRLKDNGITPADVLVRVLEWVGWMNANHGKVTTQREEDSHLARLVLTLTPYGVRYRPPGGHVIRHIGSLVREHCYLWAMRLATKLEADGDELARLKRASGDFA